MLSARMAVARSLREGMLVSSNLYLCAMLIDRNIKLTKAWYLQGQPCYRFGLRNGMTLTPKL
jgi:hypothetical protein